MFFFGFLEVFGCFWGGLGGWVSLFLRDLLVCSWKLVFFLRFSRFLGGLAAVLGSSCGPGLLRPCWVVCWALLVRFSALGKLDVYLTYTPEWFTSSTQELFGVCSVASLCLGAVLGLSAAVV